MLYYGFLNENKEEILIRKEQACFSGWGSEEFTEDMEWVFFGFHSPQDVPLANRQMQEEEWFKHYVDEVVTREDGSLSLVCGMKHSQGELFLLGTIWRACYEFGEHYHNEKVSSLINICLNTFHYFGNNHLLLPQLYGDVFFPLDITVEKLVAELAKQEPRAPFKEKNYRKWSLHEAMRSLLVGNIGMLIPSYNVPWKDRKMLFDKHIGHEGVLLK